MNKKPLRKEPRIAAVLPVRIYGMNADGKPFNSVAHTLTVSKSGARLANVDVALNVGDVIGVQKGVYKCKFRVMWVGKKGTPSQGQVGVESVEGARNIWGADDRPHSMVQEFDAASRRVAIVDGKDNERRTRPRYPCDLKVQIGHAASELRLWSRSTDISESGCYIETTNPSPVGTNFQLTLFLDEDQIVVPAEVRTSFPTMGMGIRFLFDSENQAVALRRYLRKKFAAETSVDALPTKEFPFLEKLSESVEQISAWVAATEFDSHEREQIEEFAAALCQEIQGLRAEVNHRRMTRAAAPSAAKITNAG